jgi:chloramphenicol 3-O-phosphotransferase
MSDQAEARGLLLTGVYGTGKSTIAAEIADVLEKRGDPYAAIDLDWLAWFDSPAPVTGDEILLANLQAMVGTYLSIGVRYFVMAGFFRDRAQVDELRSTLAFPLDVVRLTVPLSEIENRLSSDPTAGRKDDLRATTEWLTDGTGEGIEDFAVANEGPVRRVADLIIDRLGWT